VKVGEENTGYSRTSHHRLLPKAVITETLVTSVSLQPGVLYPPAEASDSISDYLVADNVPYQPPFNVPDGL